MSLFCLKLPSPTHCECGRKKCNENVGWNADWLSQTPCKSFVSHILIKIRSRIDVLKKNGIIGLLWLLFDSMNLSICFICLLRCTATCDVLCLQCAAQREC